MDIGRIPDEDTGCFQKCSHLSNSEPTRIIIYLLLSQLSGLGSSTPLRQESWVDEGPGLAIPGPPSAQGTEDGQLQVLIFRSLSLQALEFGKCVPASKLEYT